jgi:hypothetical protein
MSYLPVMITLQALDESKNSCYHIESGLLRASSHSTKPCGRNFHRRIGRKGSGHRDISALRSARGSPPPSSSYLAHHVLSKP